MFKALGGLISEFWHRNRERIFGISALGFYIKKAVTYAKFRLA